jgi:protein-tyrosine-phosphatase/DNA-binding transcriptional ArsR family regulator
MDAALAQQTLAALAQESRLAIFRLLVRAGPAGLTAGEIAERLAAAPATLSFHFRALVAAGLLELRQEGRFVRYFARMAAMEALIGFLTEACCEGDSSACADFRARLACPPLPTPSLKEPAMTRPYQVLFLCTGNSARSVLAEGLLNGLGEGRFVAHSAGSRPTGRIHPYAIDLLREKRLPVEGLRSKSWDEFAAPGVRAMDFIFTVCDAAAGEVCPVWPGHPLTAHWGVADPAAVEGSEAERRRAFFRAFTELERRVSLLVNLPLNKLETLALQRQLDGIGRIDQELPQ